MAVRSKLLVMFALIVGLSLLATAPLAKSIPGQYKAEIAEAEKLGKIIYEKDIAAWVGTDKMLEDLGQDVSGLPIRGWVTDKDGSRYRVNFIGEKRRRDQDILSSLDQRQESQEGQNLQARHCA